MAGRSGAGGGLSSGGSDGVSPTPTTPTTHSCDTLPAAGTFENINPPGITYQNFAFAVDPNNAGVVYVGTDKHKIWKTSDCGATWAVIDTGRNAAAIDGGINWTLLIDPQDPKVLYTNAGYGTNLGYKSVNGGVDWDVVWPPPDGTLADVVAYNFANVFAIDPLDHQHLLLTFHGECKAPYTASCIGETKDGGATWRLANGDPKMVGTEGQVIYFLDTSHTWIWGSQSSDFWRTEDSGATWTKISPAIKEAHPQGSQIYRAKDGTFYLAASDGVSKSRDGKAWSLVANTGPLGGGLVGDGTTMYLSNNLYWNWGKDLHPYFSAPESSGEPWTPLAGSPGLTAGGSLGLDTVHHVLYSSNLGAGVWRAVLP